MKYIATFFDADYKVVKIIETTNYAEIVEYANNNEDTYDTLKVRTVK